MIFFYQTTSKTSPIKFYFSLNIINLFSFILKINMYVPGYRKTCSLGGFLLRKAVINIYLL